MCLTRSATALIVLIRHSVASKVAMLYVILCILFGESDSPASVLTVYAVAARSAGRNRCSSLQRHVVTVSENEPDRVLLVCSSLTSVYAHVYGMHQSADDAMYFLAWLSALGAMGVLDVTWVLLNARCGIYKGRAAAGRSRLFVTVAWLLMLAAEASLVSVMVRSTSSLAVAALLGALAGLTIYVVFNGTTLVMDATWPVSTALLDTCWGTTLGAIGATIALLADRDS